MLGSISSMGHKSASLT